MELVGDPDRPRAWTLLVDGAPQSHVDLDDPRYLEFEYMRRLGHLVDLAAPLQERHGSDAAMKWGHLPLAGESGTDD